MKKTILSTLFVLGMVFLSNTTFAQANIEATARIAAKNAGCFDDSNGSYNFFVSEIGTCGYYCGPACSAIGILHEVLIVPNPNNNIAPYVKLSPVAKVTICGYDQVVSVECY